MRVILAPNNDTSMEVLARLKSWSGSRLLQPFCWWTVTVPEPVADPPVAPSTEVLRVDRGRALTVHLGKALSGEDPAETRLVALYAATAREGFHPNFPSRVEEHLDLASNIIAFDSTQPPECAMVAAPLDIGQPVPSDLFRSGWAANVYVAPEDRSIPTDANQLTADRFPSHAAHALACLGDLWAERRDGRTATLAVLSARQPPVSPPLVQVVRCFSRVIDFGFLPDHLATAVFGAAKEWPNPDPDRFDRMPLRAPITTRLVDQYMLKHREVLGLSEFEPLTLPVPLKLTLWQALRLLVNELVAWVLRKPFDLAEQIMANLHDTAAARIERLAGPDSEVRARGVKRWFDQEESGRSLAALAAQVDDLLIVPDGLVRPAWLDLRLLAFGLIDGSDLPDDIDDSPLRHHGKRGVVPNPNAIVPDPSLPPPLPEGEDGARACDPLRFDPTFAGPEAEPHDAGPESVAEEKDVVAEWVEARRDALVWMIGVRAGEALLKAQDEARPVPQPTQEDLRREEDQRKLRERRIKSRFRFAAVGSTTMALLIGFLAWRELSLPARIPILLLLPVLWLFALAIAARRARLRREAERRTQLERELGMLNAALLRAQRAGDEVRLGRRYREYLDWAEIIGWLAHRPWVGEPLRRVDVPAAIDAATLPAALSVASGHVVDDGMRRARNIARAEIFQSRWLATLYAGVQNRAMEEQERERKAIDDLQASVERKDPAADTSEDPDSPRRALLLAVKDGRYRGLNENPMTVDLLRLIDDLPIDTLSQGVVNASYTETVQGLPPSARWFEPPANLAELAERLRPTVVRIETTTPPGESGGTGVIVSTTGLVATSHHVVDGADAIKVVLADGTVSAATLKCFSPTADLAVLSLDSVPALEPALLAADDSHVKQGEPVITLGHPKLLEGDPTLAWGFITAARRRIRPISDPKGVDTAEVMQAAYQSAGGSSGSPVFDLDGQVMGIHCSGSVETAADSSATYLSNAVPVSELRALLSATSPPRPEAESHIRCGDFEAVQSLRPSEFLAELFEEEGVVSMLPGHWVDPDDANRVLETIPSRADDQDPGSHSERPTYRQPLRVLSHRIDLAHAVTAWNLRSCARQ